MHELEISKSLFNIIKELIEKNGLKRCIAVVEVGKLTTYAPEPIKFYFNYLKERDSFFDDIEVRLRIKEKPGNLKCKDCGEETLINSYWELLCPRCDSTNTQTYGGDQILVKKMEKW
ncbi:MAG: hydrogenase maturation nickel metallochaperone HypA [Nanoarchaeota archaeon]